MKIFWRIFLNQHGIFPERKNVSERFSTCKNVNEYFSTLKKIRENFFMSMTNKTSDIQIQKGIWYNKWAFLNS